MSSPILNSILNYAIVSILNTQEERSTEFANLEHRARPNSKTLLQME